MSLRLNQNHFEGTVHVDITKLKLKNLLYTDFSGNPRLHAEVVE